MNKIQAIMKEQGRKESWVRQEFFDKTGKQLTYKRFLALRKGDAELTISEGQALTRIFELDDIEKLID